MLTSSDFKELLNIFEKRKIRYLIVGGYAVMKYTEPRFTLSVQEGIPVEYFGTDLYKRRTKKGTAGSNRL
jgi:hypothetical protein